MSVLTVPILPQPIGDICNFDFSLLENMKTHIATEHQIQWANWPPQQCQCPASGKNPLKWKNSSALFDKLLPSDTFFLLANRSIDPNLRQIASSYIVHYDYKEVWQ